MIRRIIPVVYVLIGAVIASQHGYFASLTTIRTIASAILAIVAWPLVLFGVNFRI